MLNFGWTKGWFSIREEQVADEDANNPWLALVARDSNGEVVFRSSPTGYEHDTAPIDAAELMQTARSEAEAWVAEHHPRKKLLWNVTILSYTFWAEGWDPLLTSHELVAKVENGTWEIIDSRYRMEVYEDGDVLKRFRELAAHAFPGVPLTNL